MKTYKFKTDEEGIDNNTRTIVVEEEVTEDIKQEFTLEQKEDRLEIMKEERDGLVGQVAEAEAEITKIKIALKID